jgi:hypothetical protein
MILDQKGKCASCGDVFNNSKNTCVDHNHITGKIRGILCRTCNLALSHFNENPNKILGLLKYSQYCNDINKGVIND